MARLWRVPGDAGGVIGGEVYDWRRYGLGGRTFNNLERRAAARRPQAQPARNNYLVNKATQANPQATNAVLRAARYLRYGGPVVFLAGAGASAHELLTAAPELRPEIARRQAAGATGGAVLSGLAIGIALVGFGVAGPALIAVGLVAGIAGGIVGEQRYYAWSSTSVVDGLCRNGSITKDDLLPYAMVP